MLNEELQYPMQKVVPFRDWIPNVHYASFQFLMPQRLPPRRLYDFELLYVYQGEAVTTIWGRDHAIQAGQLLFLPAGVKHQNAAVATDGNRFLGIHFDFFHELDIHTEADMIVNEEQVNIHGFAVEAVSDQFPPLTSQLIYTPPLACVQLMEQLESEFSMRLPGYELVCRSLMMQILAYLLRLTLSKSVQHTSHHDQRMLQIIKQIEQQPSDAWTNHSIAKAMSLSIDHTARLFKHLTGMAPNTYIRTIRHREARRLLRETALPIEKISQQVGFASLHYFSRSFRQHEGISPTDYRKLSQIL
ncbi:helix-turn-helix domain-containing protein [Paenibacillus yanchengensis]|uniref:Helix-turn-helix domain-containing protein n=1 Tax=Paenibacillus yanchengensis TaxID=2035833 RepID=A0ABW4YJ18_9BACL